MKRVVAFAAILTIALMSCAVGDDDPVGDEEFPGVQEPGHSDESRRGCATPDVSDAQLAAIDLRLAPYADIALLTASHVIPVHFHIIHRSNGTGGVVTTTQINNQIAVLNAAYAPSSFSFSLSSTDHSNNDSWYVT